MSRQSTPFLVAKAKELRSRSSLAERLLWDRIRKRQVRGYKFRRRPIVEGKVPGFGCSEARLVIEIGGSLDPIKVQRDAARDQYLAKKAIRTLHLPAELIRSDLDEAVRRIRACLPQAPSRASDAATANYDLDTSYPNSGMARNEVIRVHVRSAALSNRRCLSITRQVRTFQ